MRAGHHPDMNTLCDFDNAERTCPTCGYVARRMPTYRVCSPVPPKVWRPFMVGDFVERCLKRLGITKARVEQWTRTAGKPGGCGCGSRQRWMNDYGVKVQVGIRKLAERYQRFVLP